MVLSSQQVNENQPMASFLVGGEGGEKGDVMLIMMRCGLGDVFIVSLGSLNFNREVLVYVFGGARKGGED